MARPILKFKITAKMVGGESHVVACVPIADLVAFERGYGMSANALVFDPHVEWLAFLLHRCLERERKVTVGFDQFLESLDEIDIEDAAAADEAETDAEGKVPDSQVPASS